LCHCWKQESTEATEGNDGKIASLPEEQLLPDNCDRATVTVSPKAKPGIQERAAALGELKVSMCIFCGHLSVCLSVIQ